MDKFEQIAAMNQAAKEAEQDLLSSPAIDQTELKEVAAWWDRWFMKAGHKRLGRILVKLNKEGS